MKLTILTLCLCILQVSASITTNGQNFDLQIKNQTLKEVLKEIEMKTTYRFFYNDIIMDINKTISLNLNNKNIQQVMDELLTGSEVSYKILNNNLIVIAPAVELLQTIVKGSITDSITGEKIIGASVVIEGTQTGVVSDSKGEFSIDVSRPDAVLVISFVGYKKTRVECRGQKNIFVQMAPEFKALDEIIVVGYGTVKKSDISGSVASINTEEMNRRDPENVVQGIQGMAAGVLVSQQDGSPDGNTTIRIRGVATINGSALPLYVVDGIPIPSVASTYNNANFTNNSNINFLNPTDIQSIEILKDASAAAIYGAAGANGVILITTKHGTAGATHVSFSASYGLQTLAWQLPVGDVDRFARSIRDARANDGSLLSNQVFSGQYDGKRKNINWQEWLTHPGIKSQYNLTASGGTERTQSLFSMGYLNNDGIIINSNMSRFTARANVISKVADFLEIGADINFVHKESHGSNGNQNGENNGNLSSQKDIAYNCPTMDYVTNVSGSPVYVSPNVINANGTYGTTIQSNFGSYDGGTTDNLYALQMENNALEKDNQVLLSAYGIVKLFKGLTFKSVGSYNFQTTENTNFSGDRLRYAADGVTQIVLQNVNNLQTLSINTSQNTYLGLQNYLTYNWKNDINNLTLLAGFDVNTTAGEWADVSSQGFLGSNIRVIGLTTQITSESASGATNDEVHNVSYYGRLNYSLKDRYILTATIREDGSSNFGVGNQFGTFPSAAVAWRISEENFLKGNPIINNLKLRLGWGETGNSGGQTNLSVAQVNSQIVTNGNTTNATYFTYPANGTSGLGTSQQTNIGLVPVLIDPNLKWETNIQENIGIDMTLYKNWSITVDGFNRISENLLLNRGTRPSTGYTSVYTNYGSIQNKGVEFMLSYKNNFNKDWYFSATFTGSSLVNRVIQMGADLFNYDNANTGDGSNLGGIHASAGVHWDQSSLCREGYAVGTYFGYKTLGIFQTQAEVDALNATAVAKGATYYQQAQTTAGDFHFQNTTGSGSVSTADRIPLGNGFPKLNFGLNLNASFKNWDFAVYTYGVLGQKILSYSSMVLTDMFSGDNGTAPNILRENSANAWTPANHSNTVPRLSILDYNDNMSCSDAWVKDGDFLKISNVQVAYNLPKNLLKPLKLEGLRINFSVQNLVTISPYCKYGDPEVGQGSVLYTGLDTGRYPFPRTYAVGLNLQF